MWIVPVAVILLCCTLATQAGQAKAPAQPVEVEPVRLTPTTVGRLTKAISRDTFVAVVRFTTDTEKRTVQDRTGKRTTRTVPKTGWRWFPHTGDLKDFKDFKLKGYFAVAGTFKLVKALRGKAPAMGRLDEKIEDLPHPDLDRWPHMRKEPLRPFTKAWGPDDRKHLFVIIGSPKVARVLDATFVGPVGASEIAHIESFVKLLLADDAPPAKDPAKSRALLTHKNPCLVMLGLQRLLEDGQSGTASDYATAMRTVPPQYVKTVLFRGLFQARGNARFTKDLIDQIKALRDSAPPKRLESLDAAIRAYASGNTTDLAKKLRKEFPGVVATPKKPEKASSTTATNPTRG